MIRRVLLRASLALPISFAAMTALSPARADDEKGACIASHEHAQVQRREGHLKKAHDELRLCSRNACPALVRNDCITWLDQVENLTPSVMIRADRNGNDVASVKVILDNELIASRLDGKPIEVDPGEHIFRFETEGEAPVTSTIIVREGEKSRAIPVHFGSEATASKGGGGAGPASGPAANRPIPIGVYVLGGVGVAGLIDFGVFAALGKSDQSNLQGTCAPKCSQSDIDGVKTKYLVADIGLGVGIGALAAGAIWYAMRPAKEAQGPAAPSHVAVVPTTGGALMGWSGAF